ncbi:MAG TPA: serine/threonine-protein kinase [Planctomycetota bacterium]|nr:serine/threonine-protein kinase [Planctomycetota bacterium]
MDDPPGGDSRLSDSTRKCAACGEAFSGVIHLQCLANNKTIRDGDRSPSDAARSKGTLDDLPEEASAYAADTTRSLNQYILVRQVGKGGMGAVWKAWDKKLTRWVAIKFLLVEDGEAVDRFDREAKLAARLRHPNIAAIYEVGEAPSREAGQSLRHYLAMEFIDGRTLAESKLTRPQLLDLFVKVARAVDSAHKGGVIHRDLKPPNIMVTSDLWPYVMDFGVAKAISIENSQSVSGTVVGTPAFMPPEQAEGRLSAIDARSDVYSLGATMYAVLLGRPPFEGRSVMEILRKVSTEPVTPPRQIDPSFPADVEAIVLKAMSWDPKNRYPTAGALAEDIARHLEGRRPDISLAPHPKEERKGTGKAILGIATVLLLMTGGVVAWRMVRAQAPPASHVAKPSDLVPSPQEPSRPVFRPREFPTERGTFTLKVAVHPYARIVSLSCDGEPVALDQAATPLVVPDLHLGSYELRLSHPQLGDRTVKIPRDQVRAGKTYVVWGQMERPALEVKELP